jgi:hypothetical protein
MATQRESFSGEIERIRRIRDELRLKMHLAGMEARDAIREADRVLHQVDRALVEGGRSLVARMRGRHDTAVRP